MTFLRDVFGEMPSRRVIRARLLLLGALVVMTAISMLLVVGWMWLMIWVFGR